MHYELTPQSPLERSVLERTPEARVLLEAFLPLIVARSLLAMVRLGIASALARSGRSVDELADELDLNADGLGHLLRVLTASGYVAVDRRVYRLTPLSRLTLLDGAPAQLDAWVLHGEFHWRAIAGLERALQGTVQTGVEHRLDRPEDWSVYQRAMLQTARPVADEVAGALPDPPGRDRVLDLGGAHGLYGAAICRRFPGLHSLVMDLPAALEHARALGESLGLTDVVDYEEGDILTADLGQAEHDVVFLGNVVHHVPENRLAAILDRVYRALKPGGVIAIWDMVPTGDGAEPDLVSAGFALLFHLTSAAPCRPAERHVELLIGAGFAAVEIQSGLAPTHLLITARRPFEE
jgi:SAM-dependent methyltransferase